MLGILNPPTSPKHNIKNIQKPLSECNKQTESHHSQTFFTCDIQERKCVIKSRFAMTTTPPTDDKSSPAHFDIVK